MLYCISRFGMFFHPSPTREHYNTFNQHIRKARRGLWGFLSAVLATTQETFSQIYTTYSTYKYICLFSSRLLYHTLSRECQGYMLIRKTLRVPHILYAAARSRHTTLFYAFVMSTHTHTRIFQEPLARYMRAVLFDRFRGARTYREYIDKFGQNVYIYFLHSRIFGCYANDIRIARGVEPLV